MKNVAILVQDENFPESSPIYLSQLLHNRIEKDQKLIVEPFYKNRKWKIFTESHREEIDKEKVQMKFVSYNILNAALGKLGAKQGDLIDENEEEQVTEKSEDTSDFNSFLTKISTPKLSGWPHLKDQPEIEFSYRKQLLYDEVLSYNPDLIAYQEGETRAIPTKFSKIINYNSKFNYYTIKYNTKKQNIFSFRR